MQVKIYKPAKTAMQSGKGKKSWILEFVLNEPKFIDPIMGWTGNCDTEQQIKLKFSSRESAIKYAEREKLDYVVFEPNVASLKLQSYSDTLLS